MLQKLKYILFIGQLLITVSVFAELGAQKSDWDIYSDDNGYYLGLKEKQFKLIKITSQSFKPKIMKVIPYKERKNIVFIHYYAGESGTSQIIKQFHVVVFNTHSQEFLGQAPYKYVSATPGLTQPKWIFKKDHILVRTPYIGKIKINFD